jgi:hypothetical protein
MSKKALVISILLVVLIGGVLWYREKQARQALHPEGLSVPVTGIAANEPAADSSLRKLSQDVSFAVAVYPQELKPAIDNLQGFAQKISATKAWKELNPGTNIEAIVTEHVFGPEPDSAAQLKGLTQSALKLSQLLQQNWNSIKEVVLAASQSLGQLESPASESKIRMPRLFLGLSFASPDLPAKLYKNVSILIPEGRTELKGEDFSLTKISPDGKVFQFSTPLKNEVTLTMELEFAESGIMVFIGPDARQAFLNTTQGPLLSSQKWQSLSPARLIRPAVMAYMDSPALGQIAKQLLETSSTGLTPEAVDSVSRAWLQTFNSLGVSSFSTTVSDGWSFKQCQLPSSGEISALKEVPVALTADSRQFITNGVILAGSASGRAIAMAVDAAAKGYQADTQNQQELPDSWKRFQAQINAVKSALKKLQLRDAGLVVNAPSPGAFMPELGVYLTSQAPLSLTSFSEILNGLFAAISQGEEDAATPAPKAQVVNDPSGGERIEIGSGEMPAVRGLLLGKSTILLSTGESLFQLASGSSGRYLDPLLAARPALKSHLEQSEMYEYLNTGAVIDFGKGFLPLLLMQKPDVNLDQASVDELLNLLKVSVLSATTYSQDPQGLFCSDSKTGILQ